MRTAWLVSMILPGPMSTYLQIDNAICLQDAGTGTDFMIQLMTDMCLLSLVRTFLDSGAFA